MAMRLPLTPETYSGGLPTGGANFDAGTVFTEWD